MRGKRGETLPYLRSSCRGVQLSPWSRQLKLAITFIGAEESRSFIGSTTVYTVIYSKHPDLGCQTHEDWVLDMAKSSMLHNLSRRCHEYGIEGPL